MQLVLLVPQMSRRQDLTDPHAARQELVDGVNLVMTLPDLEHRQRSRVETTAFRKIHAACRCASDANVPLDGFSAPEKAATLEFVFSRCRGVTRGIGHKCLEFLLSSNDWLCQASQGGGPLAEHIENIPEMMARIAGMDSASVEQVAEGLSAASSAWHRFLLTLWVQRGRLTWVGE